MRDRSGDVRSPMAIQYATYAKVRYMFKAMIDRSGDVRSPHGHILCFKPYDSNVSRRCETASSSLFFWEEEARGREEGGMIGTEFKDVWGREGEREDGERERGWRERHVRDSATFMSTFCRFDS